MAYVQYAAARRKAGVSSSGVGSPTKAASQQQAPQQGTWVGWLMGTSKSAAPAGQAAAGTAADAQTVQATKQASGFACARACVPGGRGSSWGNRSLEAHPKLAMPWLGVPVVVMGKLPPLNLGGAGNFMRPSISSRAASRCHMFLLHVLQGSTEMAAMGPKEWQLLEELVTQQEVRQCRLGDAVSVALLRVLQRRPDITSVHGLIVLPCLPG